MEISIPHTHLVNLCSGTEPLLYWVKLQTPSPFPSFLCPDPSKTSQLQKSVRWDCSQWWMTLSTCCSSACTLLTKRKVFLTEPCVSMEVFLTEEKLSVSLRQPHPQSLKIVYTLQTKGEKFIFVRPIWGRHIPEYAQFETHFWSCSFRIIVQRKKMAERNAPKCCKWRPIILWVYLVHSKLLVMSSATIWWLESKAQANQTSGRGIQASSPHRPILTQGLSQL